MVVMIINQAYIALNDYSIGMVPLHGLQGTFWSSVFCGVHKRDVVILNGLVSSSNSLGQLSMMLCLLLPQALADPFLELYPLASFCTRHDLLCETTSLLSRLIEGSEHVQ